MYFKTKKSATFEDLKIDDLFALLLLYADILAAINLAELIPSATLAREYATRRPQDWNSWLDIAVLTGVPIVDKLLITFAKTSVKGYDDL